jgi:predicted deacetylase
MNGPPEFLFAVHDTAPIHLEKLLLAEKLIEEFSIPEVCFFLVPNFHNRGPSDQHEEFVSWCRASRSFSVEWFLHGYFHLETGDRHSAGMRGWVNNLKRSLLTAGEGEFLELTMEEIRERIVCGMKIFHNCTNENVPYGFVSPAWLHNHHLMNCLYDLGIAVTEDHRFIYNISQHVKLKCPVITWATRTVLRKYAALAVCPCLVHLWKNSPLIRIAVHPSDFEHSLTLDNIRKVLDKIMSKRTAVSYRHLAFRRQDQI